MTICSETDFDNKMPLFLKNPRGVCSHSNLYILFIYYRSAMKNKVLPSLTKMVEGLSGLEFGPNYIVF
jgi:hypothetical protein